MSHIALLLPDLEVGGAQRVMLLLAKEFYERGFQVDVISLSGLGPLRELVPSGVNVVGLGARSYGVGHIGFLISSVIRLAIWEKRKAPSVLLSSINGANLAVLLMRKIFNSPSRIVVREAASVVAVAKGLRLNAMRWLYPGADCVIALNSVMAKELIELVGVSKKKIRCIANPVDAESIVKQAQCPLEHPWAKEGVYKLIVSVGRLIPEKGYFTLIKAFSLLRNCDDARLVIVGEGGERRRLESLVKGLNLSGRVDLVGYEINPWRWIGRASVFVLSSFSEGYPNSLLEAITLRVPAVATEYDSSVWDIEEKFGIDVISVGDEDKLARKIEEKLLTGRLPRVNVEDEKGSIVDAYLCALGCSK